MIKDRVFVPGLLTALAFFAYRSCFDIFIPGDNYSFLHMFESEGPGVILKNAQEGAPYFVAYPLLYLLYQLFGVNTACWMVTSVFLHAVNAFLVFLIARKLLTIVLAESSFAVSLLAALIFLLSPYQTEDVLWTAINIRWLFHAGVTLSGLLIFIHHIEKPDFKKIAAVHFLFLMGLFSHELTLVLPLAYVVLFLLYRKLSVSAPDTKGFFIQTLLPQAIFVFIYFLVCKLVSGHWLWHAGTVGDIIQTNDYSKTLLKYFAKFFLFYRYVPFGQADELLRSVAENKWLMLVSTLLLLATGVGLFRKIIFRNEKEGYLLAAFFACFIIFLLPVLPLDSSFLKYIYPDRYGYLPSAFFYAFLAFAAYLLLKKIALPVLTGYILVGWFFLGETIALWSASNKHCKELTLNYEPFLKNENVYVLSIPAYYKGVAAFRSAFKETIFMNYGSPAGPIHVISGCYRETETDTLTSVEVIGQKVTVTGPQKTTPYFSTNGGWARSYETDEYEVIYDPSGCSYTLVFKHEIPSNSVFIYANNGTWKKAD